jgi:hypothetical protein
LVLDAGALIAIERNDRQVWLALKRAASQNDDVIVPSTVVAQVWRASAAQARLARVLQYCVIAPFDGFAREIGALCGRAKTRDICDSHVALVASRAARLLYTSDLDDMRHLLRMIGDGKPQLVRC